MVTIIKLYLVDFYETYRADEQGTRWMLTEPKGDGIYYKSETLEVADFVLPEGFEVKDSDGCKYVTKDGEEYDIVTEKDGTVELVGSEIVELKKMV